MVSSRELCRDVASFYVYLSVFLHVFILNFVYSKCPKSFPCGNLGNLEFPLANSSQPECGLLTVQCNARPYPRLHPDTQRLSPSSEILSNISTNQALIRNPILESYLQNKSCRLFLESNIPNTHKSISLIFFPNITLIRCPKNMNSEEDDEIRRLHQSYRNYTNCDGFDIYYANSNENLPPPVPYNCSVLYLPLKSQPIPDSADLFERLGTDYNIEWNLSDDCIGCHRGGGKCSADANNQFRCVKGRSKSKLVYIAGASVATVILFSVVFFTFKKRKYKLNLKGKPQIHKDIELFLKNNENLVPRRYNYSDLKKMTNSFSDNLGEGGFASVYRGKLFDGCLVAVKILKELKGNGEEFINEVASISRTSHVNIVTLIGFCFEGSKRALIYEFMPNGSLEKFIGHNSPMAELQLGWEKLFQIAVGIAQGIEYLHQGCTTRILHFDIKPHNILLDKDFNPKISDFGLSRLCPNRSSIVSMSGARGTIGYIAPEIFCRNFGDVSHKSDVYSYGMMILEMAGQTKNIEVSVGHSSESYFPDWIYKNLEQNVELDLNIIVNANERLRIRKMLIVGLWCIQTDPRTRPSMSRVLEMLEGNMESLQVPPNPNFFLQPREAVNPSTFESSLSFSDVHEVKL